MSIEIKIPDIGGATDVDVIEVMISVGDEVQVDDSLITLESDKASMEIPSPQAGKVTEVVIKVGDKVNEGHLILLLEPSSDTDSLIEAPVAEASVDQVAKAPLAEVNELTIPTGLSSVIDVCVPDIGDANDVDVIDVIVKPGDSIEQEQSLITLEGDKATMEIPSTKAGIVESMVIKVGDKVSQGDVILTLSVQEQRVNQAATQAVINTEPPKSQSSQPVAKQEISSSSERVEFNDKSVYAGPAVRRFARELGVDLNLVKGSGRKGRVTKQDVRSFVKVKLQQANSSQAGGFSVPPAPKIDFAKFGEIESVSLNKIKRLTATNMHRSWVTVPHVTQFDEADVTSLETFRKANKVRAEREGYKLTLLAFVVKACAYALKRFPQINASLAESGEELILKHYCHIGIAVDTPNGLMVPVIRDCDKKSVADIARDMASLSVKARDKKLTLQDMSGGCFTISSLGGIGGTAFTPIVNHPEVAILGLSRNQTKPVYDNGQWVPRLMLPMSLSYDHRVIDGAEAARFSQFLSQSLSDIRTLLL